MKLHIIHYEPKNIQYYFKTRNCTQSHMSRCHKDENVTKTYRHGQVRTKTHLHDMYLFWHVVYQPCLASLTLSRIYQSPNGQQGITHHVVPLLHVISRPYLASPTHSRIYLFPLLVARNDVSHSTLLHVVFWPYGSGLTHILKNLPASCKVKGSNLTLRHKDRVITCHKDVVITNIIAQGQTHIKSSQVKCSQSTQFTSKQFHKIFSKSLKPFLVKIFYINLPSNKTR